MNVASDGCSRASRTDYLRPGPASAEEGSQVLVGASTMDVRYPLRVPLPSRRQLDQVYFVALDAQQSRGAASVIHQIALQQTDNSTLLSTAAKPRMSVSRCSLQARRRSGRAPTGSASGSCAYHAPRSTNALSKGLEAVDWDP